MNDILVKEKKMTNDKEFNKAKKEAIKTARELCYSKECILKLEKANTYAEISNILKTERTTKK